MGRDQRLSPPAETKVPGSVPQVQLAQFSDILKQFVLLKRKRLIEE
jgi:hypothetical protein